MIDLQNHPAWAQVQDGGLELVALEACVNILHTPQELSASRLASIHLRGSRGYLHDDVGLPQTVLQQTSLADTYCMT